MPPHKIMRSLIYYATVSLLCISSQQHECTAESDPSDRPSPIANVDLPGKPQRLSSEHLANLVRVHRKVFSGGLPADEAAFQELQTLGVKTIISVDGARPDVQAAKKFSLRYVHLPHGYDGIPEQRVKALAKAVRELPGPIYIHCHHGKHRSPAAASVACVAAGLTPQSSALAVLAIAGTSKNYRGLYQSAKSAKPLEQALLKELKVEFSETVEVPPMAEAMVAIEHTHDRLQEIEAAGWRTPQSHPDLDPAHEALLLREHFTELLRTDYVQQQPAEFQDLLVDSKSAAQSLEAELRAWQPTSEQSRPPTSLQQLARRINKNCVSCHQQFRDVPLSEKTQAVRVEYVKQ